MDVIHRVGLAPVAQLKRVEVKSVWQEAREQIDAWEKADPTATHMVLVLDGAVDTHLSVAGPPVKPSHVAGLCMFAAAMAVE